MKSSDDFRQWHYLRPLVGSECPSSILVVDTETMPIADKANGDIEHHHLKLWCAKYFRLDGTVKTRCADAFGTEQNSFWEFVNQHLDDKRPLWLFAHNLGFDLTVLGFWLRVEAGDWEFTQPAGTVLKGSKKATAKPWSGIAVLNDPPTILRFRFPNTTKTVVAVDTYNYFRTSLAEIGRSVGAEKQPMPEQADNFESWVNYCRNDVYILERAVCTLIDFVRGNKLGRFGYTIASQAMNAFRSRFMPPDSKILIHGNRQAIRLERDSYYGGVVHFLYRGHVDDYPLEWDDANDRIKEFGGIRGPIYCLDYRSFYPSIMRDSLIPYRLDKVICDPSMSQFQDALCQHAIIANVNLNCVIPGFPVRRNSEVFYATGKFNTTLAYPELMRAYYEGAILSIPAMATYKTARLFRDYVDYFHKMRRHYESAGNAGMAYVAKLLMNSLYGKFAMKKHRWDDARGKVAPMPYGYWWEFKETEQKYSAYRAMAWLPQQQCSVSCHEMHCDGETCVNPGHCKSNPLEYNESFPAISSYITSYGREIVLATIDAAGQDNVLYSDTDSLHVTQQGYNNLIDKWRIDNVGIGGLHVIQKVMRAEYRGPKDYTLDGVDTIAGVKKNAEPTDDGRFIQPMFQRLGSILDGSNRGSVAVERVCVLRPQHSIRGQVLPNGRVQTVRLEE